MLATIVSCSSEDRPLYSGKARIKVSKPSRYRNYRHVSPKMSTIHMQSLGSSAAAEFVCWVKLMFDKNASRIPIMVCYCLARPHVVGEEYPRSIRSPVPHEDAVGVPDECKALLRVGLLHRWRTVLPLEKEATVQGERSPYVIAFVSSPCT